MTRVLGNGLTYRQNGRLLWLTLNYTVAVLVLRGVGAWAAVWYAHDWWPVIPQITPVGAAMIVTCLTVAFATVPIGPKLRAFATLAARSNRAAPGDTIKVVVRETTVDARLSSVTVDERTPGETVRTYKGRA